MIPPAPFVSNEDREERERIDAEHRQLREDFLQRDAERFPDGWQLPDGPREVS